MAPQPFIENSRVDYDENASDANPDHRHVQPLYTARTANTIICTLVIVACVAGAAYIWTSAAHARQNQTPRPVLRPVGLVQAKHECPAKGSLVECRAALRRALAAKEWQRHEVQHILERTRGKQPFAYAARLAYAACVSFSADPTRCKPPSQMLAVGRCESGLQIHDPNPSSTADNWMQFLSGTWYSQPIAKLGWFSRFDALAVAIAAETMSRGGWGAWRASRYCHGLS